MKKYVKEVLKEKANAMGEERKKEKQTIQEECENYWEKYTNINSQN